jgi:hypothetical protein
LGQNFDPSNDSADRHTLRRITPKLPPRVPPGFPDLKWSRPKTPIPGGGLRRRWKDADNCVYEWDYLHGRLEKYTRQGKHIGEFDPETREKMKDADSTRSIEP